MNDTPQPFELIFIKNSVYPPYGYAKIYKVYSREKKSMWAIAEFYDGLDAALLNRIKNEIKRHFDLPMTCLENEREIQ